MPSPLTLIYGESPNDTAALKHLVPALIAPLEPPLCRPIREPGTLSRGAAVSKRNAVAKAIAIVAKHEAKSRQVVVVSHEDCDECEDAHINRMDSIKAELNKAGVTKVVAAAPAWEIETWWMLFPEALASVRKCWSKVDFSGRQVGRIENSKEILRRALRPAKSVRCLDYAESDSERIAEEIARQGLINDNQRIQKSASLLAFKHDLQEAFTTT